MPPICDCLSTSSRRKRTSNLPSESRFASPMSRASARRLFHSGKSTCAISVGSGLTPPTNIARKRPLRERSCSTISVMLCGRADSPAKGSTAMGIWLAPPPMISMVSWPRAPPVRRSNAARSVAGRVIRGRSIPSSPLFLRPELERQFPLKLIGPVGPGQRRALQYRALDRVVVIFVAARFSEPRGKHFARGELYDIEDRFRVPLEVGRRNDVGPDSRANFLYVPGVAHGSGGRRELLQRLLLLAAAAERLLLLRELLADALRRIELERRLFLLLRLLFPLERDVGLRRLLFDLGLGSGLRLGFGLGLHLGCGRLERRQLGPQLGHDRIRVLRLPAQAENQYGEEHPVHQQRQSRRCGAARFVRRNRVAHCVAGFTSSPTRRMLCRCSSSITFSTAS